jgi:hypothetical protein
MILENDAQAHLLSLITPALRPVVAARNYFALKRAKFLECWESSEVIQ